MKIVIDDYGYSLEVNESIHEILLNSHVDEVAIIVNSDYLTNLDSLKNVLHKTLHLNLLEGRPVMSGHKYIVNKSGKFNLTFQKSLLLSIFRSLNKSALDEIKIEIDAQVDKFCKLFGVDRLNINGHRHIHLIPFIYEILGNHNNVQSIRHLSEKIEFYMLRFVFNLRFLNNIIKYFIINILNIYNGSEKRDSKPVRGILLSGLSYLYRDSDALTLFHPGLAIDSNDNISENRPICFYLASARKMEWEYLYNRKLNFNTH